MKKYAFGIDVGGTSVKLGFFSAEGELLEKWEIPTDISENGKNVIPDIASEIRKKLEEHGLGTDALEGVGLDVPGAVTGESIVNRCVNLGWDVLNASEELSGMLNGTKVKTANDANAAALGETWKGAGRGCENLVMVTIGTGVGAGIIVNGKIIEGAHGSAGEVGHNKLNTEETEKCGCGGRGCIEQYTSAMWVGRQCSRALASYEGGSVLKDVEKVSSRAIFDAAKAGDEFAAEFVDEICRKLALVISSAANTLDPEVIVIGGGMSKAGDILIDGIRKYYREYAFHAVSNTPVIPAELGNDAGMYGAVKLVLD